MARPQETVWDSCQSMRQTTCRANRALRNQESLMRALGFGMFSLVEVTLQIQRAGVCRSVEVERLRTEQDMAFRGCGIANKCAGRLARPGRGFRRDP